MSRLSKDDLFFITTISILSVAGYIVYSKTGDYSHLSAGHFRDIIISKLWSISAILSASYLIYKYRNHNVAPRLAVLSVSVYFVILYGILFHGTEYGQNGIWGDNANRLALICKMMTYNSFYQDWYLKDLPSFYPPLWFYTMALMGKLLNLEAYQTIKFGYLFIFLFYPLALFSMWKKIISPAAAAAVVVGVVFFAFRYLDWIYYEHITAALFVPWYLHYFYPINGSPIKYDWKFFLFGSIIGALIFMTYYFWYFMAFIAFLITLFKIFRADKSELIPTIKHCSLLMIGVAAISSIYWLPLMVTIIEHGLNSSQNVWFHLGHANLSHEWQQISIESLMMTGGVFFLFYYRNDKHFHRLLYLLVGGIGIIIIDRVYNIFGSSFQSRKILEFAHLFLIIPLSIGLYKYYQEEIKKESTKHGLLGVLVLLLLIVGNGHTEVYKSEKYKIGYNQQTDEKTLGKLFDEINTYDKVFLTDQYIWTVYRPFYLFVPLNNMTAHAAAQYEERCDFLDLVSKITEPQLMVYLLIQNKYSSIDYIYLPVDENSGKYLLKLYQVEFNKKTNIKEIRFELFFDDFPEYFLPTKAERIFELSTIKRNDSIDNLVEEKYPDLMKHLSD